MSVTRVQALLPALPDLPDLAKPHGFFTIEPTNRSRRYVAHQIPRRCFDAGTSDRGDASLNLGLGIHGNMALAADSKVLGALSPYFEKRQLSAASPVLSMGLSRLPRALQGTVSVVTGPGWVLLCDDQTRTQRYPQLERLPDHVPEMPIDARSTEIDHPLAPRQAMHWKKQEVGCDARGVKYLDVSGLIVASAGLRIGVGYDVLLYQDAVVLRVVEDTARAQYTMGEAKNLPKRRIPMSYLSRLGTDSVFVLACQNELVLLPDTANLAVHGAEPRNYATPRTFSELFQPVKSVSPELSDARRVALESLSFMKTLDSLEPATQTISGSVDAAAALAFEVLGTETPAGESNMRVYRFDEKLLAAARLVDLDQVQLVNGSQSALLVPKTDVARIALGIKVPSVVHRGKLAVVEKMLNGNLHSQLCAVVGTGWILLVPVTRASKWISRLPRFSVCAAPMSSTSVVGEERTTLGVAAKQTEPSLSKAMLLPAMSAGCYRQVAVLGKASTRRIQLSGAFAEWAGFAPQARFVVVYHRNGILVRRASPMEPETGAVRGKEMPQLTIRIAGSDILARCRTVRVFAAAGVFQIQLPTASLKRLNVNEAHEYSLSPQRQATLQRRMARLRREHELDITPRLPETATLATKPVADALGLDECRTFACKVRRRYVRSGVENFSVLVPTAALVHAGMNPATDKVCVIPAKGKTYVMASGSALFTALDARGFDRKRKTLEVRASQLEGMAPEAVVAFAQLGVVTLRLPFAGELVVAGN